MLINEAGHPDATDLTRDFSPGNSDAMDILSLGLGLGRVLGRQDVPGLKNTGVNFLASGRLRQVVADPLIKGRIETCESLPSYSHRLVTTCG